MKNRWTLLPWKQLNKVVSVLTFGAEKHGDHGYKKRTEKEYLDAALRHIVEHLRGVTEDHETGEPPLAHAVADLLIAMEIERAEEKHVTPDEILPYDIYGPITELPYWAEWVAVDENGEVWVYEEEPYTGGDVWWWSEGSDLWESVNKVDPPADWTQTKRRIKR